MIEGMKGDFAGKYRCEAYAWLAVAVASREKERAVTFIDRALAVPLDNPCAFQSWTYFGGVRARPRGQPPAPSEPVTPIWAAQ